LVVTSRTLLPCFGDKDAAFYWLQVAYNQREGSLIPLKIVPYYDPLRRDRRFTSLLQHIGLNSAHKPN
jgi:hypothetical protein